MAIITVKTYIKENSDEHQKNYSRLGLRSGAAVVYHGVRKGR